MNHQRLPSPHIDPLENSGFHGSKLLSSSPDAWSGMSAYYFHSYPTPELTVVPDAVSNNVHTLILQVEGVVDLQRIAEGHLLQERSQSGALFIGPHGQPQAWAWNATVKLLHVHLSPDLLTTVAADVSTIDPQRVELIDQFNLHDPFMQQAMLAILTELHTPNLGGQLYVEALGYALGLHLLRGYSSLARVGAPPAAGLSQQQVRRALDYIHDQLDRPIALTDLASHLNLSPTYFARQFKQATGLAPHQYLIQQRLKKAHALLASSQMTVAQVATLTGFADQSHLIRHFKRAFGSSPRMLREERKNVQHAHKIVQATEP